LFGGGFEWPDKLIGRRNWAKAQAIVETPAPDMLLGEPGLPGGGVLGWTPA